MIPILTWEEYRSKLKTRMSEVEKKVTDSVEEIINQVKLRGIEAVKDYSIMFDGQAPDEIELSKADMEKSLDRCDKGYIDSLMKAADNIKDFHLRQKSQSWLTAKENGVILGQRIRGIERAGVYVPGGTAAYPSSVLMNIIPAKIAEVKEIVMATPPTINGGQNDNIISAAHIAGADRIFLMGGAQAIAALAYGAGPVPKVDKITGPGNIYVATAKKLLYGTVDIDMIAGPSEILIVADETANPRFIAADLMSQAEHDVLASAVLITVSEEVAKRTVEELNAQINKLSRKSIIEKSLNDFGAIIICDSVEQMIDYANQIAPEHLEVLMKNPMEYIGKFDNAGSVFLGSYSPEPLGDYFAGPNHVLPTSGSARFFSPLSVDSFIKKSSFIYSNKEALKNDKDDIIRLAEAEGLTAHANSIRERF